jgi:restriction system protein
LIRLCQEWNMRLNKMKMKKPVFVLRADFGRYTDSFEKEQYIGIGWFNESPTGWNLDDKEYLKEQYRLVYPDDPNMRMNQNVGQIYRFVNEMKIGDIVLSPFMDNHLLVGVIESELFFKSDSTSPYPWRKKVKWFKEKIDRHTLSVPLQNTLKSSLTCFKVSSADEVLFELGLISKSDSSSMYDEGVTPISNFEIIRRRFLELDATEFEYLVAYMLRTLGFEPTQEIGKVGDGGIDFEGILDVSGIASINLQVQVKRYDKGVIGEKDIRNFRGALKKDFQGCFLTLSSFNKKAIESASDKERSEIQLIDGMRFTEIFIEQYEKIIDAMFNDDMDDLAGKLKFKKSLLPV